MRPLSVCLVVAVFLTVGVAPVQGATQSENATCSYDETELREFQPETTTDHLSVEPTASYGGIFTSPDRETAVYVYFLSYPTQDGVTPVDSHESDREPVYVVVDEDTDEVKRVQYSAYHYLKGAATPSNLSMNGSNVQLHVVEPWHHYRPAATDGSYAELRNYCTAVNRWVESGWGAAADAVTHPWTMSDRASWWEADSLRNEIAAQYRDARQFSDGEVQVLNGTVG